MATGESSTGPEKVRRVEERVLLRLLTKVKEIGAGTSHGRLSGAAHGGEGEVGELAVLYV